MEFSLDICKRRVSFITVKKSKNCLTRRIRKEKEKNRKSFQNATLSEVLLFECIG